MDAVITFWPKPGLCIASLGVLGLLACGRSTPPEPAAPAPQPSAQAPAELSRVVPRRTNPLVVVAPDVSRGAPPQATNTPPTVTCGSSQALPCTAADGIQITLPARAADADGDALSVVWAIDGAERYTQQVVAGNPATVADVAFAYTLTPGDHTIKVTVLDGELSASCEMTVTIQKDTEPPVLTCPADIAVPADPGQCGALVAFSVTATDNCPEVTITSAPPSGTAFPIGTTTVLCSATDSAGNVAEGSFTVTVGFTNRCPKNDTYWGQHPAAWPLASVQIGGQVYTRSQLLPLLRSSVRSDASLVLARQMIAAMLNTAYGSDPRPICGDLAQANRTLAGFSGKLPYRVNVSSSAGGAMVRLSTRLSSYNRGMLTGDCLP